MPCSKSKQFNAPVSDDREAMRKSQPGLGGRWRGLPLTLRCVCTIKGQVFTAGTQ